MFWCVSSAIKSGFSWDDGGVLSYKGSVAADAVSRCKVGKLSQWTLGATWTRMVAGEGKEVVGGLSGQQVGYMLCRVSSASGDLLGGGHHAQYQRCYCQSLICSVFLSALQWGVLVTDNAPGSSSSSVAARSATFSFHQLLHAGETSLAAEYSMPLAPQGALLLYSHLLCLDLPLHKMSRTL
jgi:uncharacterized membrane protein